MTDFNNIKQWLIPQLDKLSMSVEQFANTAGLSRAAIYHYFEDRHRPDEQSMARICHVLGVPLEQGLRQYTQRKRGKPRGMSSSTRPLSVRA